MLIPGENAMIFIPNDYGFTLLIGHVAAELPHGWIVDPCREVLEIPDADRLVDIAAGKDKAIRGRCRFGPFIKGGFRCPFGVGSILWHGELPS